MVCILQLRVAFAAATLRHGLPFAAGLPFVGNS
jgi:hypothetical protein